VIDDTPDGQQGRPPADTPLTALAWQRQAQGRPEAERRGDAKQRPACGGLGTPIEVEQRSDAEGRGGDTGHAQAEGGCRWLHAPLLFVASLFGQKPARLQGLWMGMT